MQTLNDALDRYRGRPAMIVGPDDGRFDHREIARFKGPLVFIGEAIRHVADAGRVADVYWLPVGPEGETRLRRHTHCGLPVVTAEQAEAHQPASALVYHVGEYTDRRMLRRNAAAVAESGALAGDCPVLTAVHLTHVMGCDRVLLVGCGDDQPARTIGMPAEVVRSRYLRAPIPAVAHMIWLGSEPPAWVIQLFDRLVAHNEGWRCHLWKTPPTGLPVWMRNLLTTLPYLSQRANVLGAWLLHEHGGVVLDADTVVLRSLDPLRRFDQWLVRDGTGTISAAAMGAKPAGPGTDLLLQQLRRLGKDKDGPRPDREFYGRTLLSWLYDRPDEPKPYMDILPAHWTSPFTPDTATMKALATLGGNEQAFDVEGDDGEQPFMYHLWGSKTGTEKPLYDPELLKKRRPSVAAV